MLINDSNYTEMINERYYWLYKKDLNKPVIRSLTQIGIKYPKKSHSIYYLFVIMLSEENFVVDILQGMVKLVGFVNKNTEEWKQGAEALQNIY